MRLLIADAFFHLRDGGAMTHHFLDHFARVAGRGHRPLHGSAGSVLVTHALIASEATGVHEHTEPRTDQPTAAVLDRRDTFDRAVFDDELADWRFGPNRHTGS